MEQKTAPEIPETVDKVSKRWRGSHKTYSFNMLYHIVLCILILWGQEVKCERGLGGSILVPMTLDRQDAPYLVLEDIIVEETGELTIRPGVKLLFAPAVGITVFGRLIAEGTETERIVMSTSMKTPSQNAGRLNTNRNNYNSNYNNANGLTNGDNHRFFSTVEYATDTDTSVHQLLEDAGSAGSNESETNTDSSVNIIRQQRSTADPISVRLTEGPSPLMGRLQIHHRGQWRSVCTNSRNWTAIDMHTVCKELGFTGGEYWTWVDHLNDTKQLLWEKPECLGVEGRVKECSNWASRQLGAGVCDHHPNLGIRCDPYHIFPSNVENHWRGLRFDNARYRETYSRDNTLRIKESLSSLKYVDVLYAGVGSGYNVTSALETIGVPPSMSFLRVEYSAFSGLNITNPSTKTAIRNSTISYNTGFGIYVNSSLTCFEIEGCTVEGNGGDGVRYIFHDAVPDQKVDRIDPFEFCTIPTTNQIYPLRLYFEQLQNSFSEKGCRKRFTVRPGYVLTMHFPYMLSQDPGGAEFLIYDGVDSRGNLLSTVSVQNETWIQSVTSTRDSLYVEFKSKAHNKVLVYMDLVAGKSKDYEFRVSHSVVSGNNGRGLAIENMRSQIIVEDSIIRENSHIAGIHVLGGVGHVNVSHSSVISNFGDGINITYGGGSRNISSSKIFANTLRGISIWFNESSIKKPNEQETVIEYSEIARNLGAGIFVGNFCTNGVVNISGNTFSESKKSAIEVWSCWNPLRSKTFKNLLTLQIGHNHFINNQDFGIKLKPLINADALIEHNYFRGNTIKGCLVINGQDKKELEILPAKIEVSNNVFEGNSGYFVASLGLNHFSQTKQKLIFTQNFVRYNRIQDPSGLNPRSRAPAALVLSSSNIDIFRNILQNPDSKYEISSQMEDQSFELNCTYNWLGSTEERIIYYRIFDRKDRFNLARVNYIPYLLNPTDPNTEIAMSTPQFVPTFDNPEKVIGGEITGRETLTAGEYKVVRDISVRPGGRLQISYGVTLKFLPSVGIMVGGQFHSEGFGYGDGEMVKFTLFDLGRMNATDAPVRLVGGKTRKDGRLQVRIGNVWGSICNYGFDAQAAAIACRQMGFVLNPSDWLLEGFEIPQASPSEQILMSNIQCSEWDHDLTKCLAEMNEDIENSCTLDNLVGIRCYDTSWAGIRMAITADKGVMKFSMVEKAGLLDPHTNEHKPAIQLDFTHHVFSDIRVTDNTGDGLGIIYSDIYFPDAVNTVERSEFSRNLGNGILLRQLGLHLKDCLIENNKLAGILHDPAILRPHQREMAGWVTVGKRDNIIHLPMRDRDLWLDPDSYRYLITDLESDVSEVYNIVAKDQNYVISLQLLNPIHNESSENIWIYDRMDIPAKDGTEYFHDLEIWSVQRDMVSFPTTTSSYGLTLWIKTGSKPRGNCILLVRAIRAPVNRFLRSGILPGPVPKLKIFDTKIRNNGRGIETIHYNRNENEYGDLYLRKANESIEILRSDISFNRGEAVFAYTPFREIYSANISEITFTINSTTITDNDRGIVQYSRDQRNSNNLYHWIMRDNSIDRNREGGFQVSLPYVWQYNENHTHSVHIQNVTFRHNQNFESGISGHFAKVTIVDTIFENNVCRTGVFSLSGMEKEIVIFNNQFLSNRASYVVQFDTDSQSEIVGQVQAHFVRNIVKFNTFNSQRNHRESGGNSRRGRHLNATYQPRSYAIGIKGVQKINVTNNLFGDNQLDYELLAGVTTAKLDNMVNVIHNWWGTSDPWRIKERIFDFDDWNSYAIASYRPYYLQDTLESSISLSYESENDVTLDHLQGRLMYPLTLYYRDQPYVIKSDLTIMPSAQLTIAPGVQIEFYPSVGILALGPLIAQGTFEDPIMMRPITLQKMETLDTMQRMRGLDTENTIRLCAEDKCETGIRQGFLEYFNKTTLQWIPMCDNRFTERNVQVICRQLGFDYMNIFFDFGQRIEFHYNSLRRIRKWPEPFQCVGDETSLDDCPIRMNGQLYGYDYPCEWNDPFIFINCGERNLNKSMEYWGGIRFSEPDFEQHLFESRMHDAVTHSSYEREESILEYVNILGAGILHNEKSPAILSIQQSPIIRCVNVTKSAHHGISIVSAHKTLRMTKNAFIDNMGLGFSGISLTGEAQRSDSSSFFPLTKIEIPYGMFGLVHICDPNKEIIVEERVVLYYKYDNFPVDCVKIFKSVYGAKNLGFRLMQLNLFNSTGKPWPPDYIKLIDGDIYNSTTEEISTITMDYDPHTSNKFYQSTWPSLSVKLHATGATAYHGFVAEVLTLPVSPHGLDRSIQHNISYSIFQNNSQGAFYYGSAGEISPIVTLEKNRFEDNCEAFYGNFTSCNSTVRFDVQNMLNIYFKNNVLRRNQGGIHITSDSSGTATSLKGYIHNNIFENNSNREIVHVEGRRSSPYQEIVFYRNIVTRNDANFADVVVLSQVVSNLTDNYFSANRGGHIMEITGFDKVRLPIYQSCTHNSFFMNVATDIENKATIVAGSTGQQYIDNIFVNPTNAYELITVNKSRPRAISYEPQSAVDARHNWWGYKEDIPVMGRIKDENDNIDLLRVLFLPYRTDNRTLLSGKCPPGYSLVSDTCYMYVGGHMTYAEAKEFCRRENASMPYVESSYYYVTNFLRNQQEDYDYYDRVWVQDVDRFGECTVFVTGDVKVTECSYRLPFICETDPKISIDPLAWTTDSVTIGAIVATILALVLIVFILIFWYTKSKQRQSERLERRNSVRASIRSSRSFASSGSLNESEYRRRLAEFQKSINRNPEQSLNNYNKINGSFDSIEKTNSQFDSTSYDMYDTQTQRTGMSSDGEEPIGLPQISKHPMGRPRPSIPSGTIGLPPPPPSHVRNVRADVQVPKPFDLTFQNQNFRETPSTGSIGMPNDYWDSTPHLQSNGHGGIKYKNTNPSIGTTSTFPLQPSNDNMSEISSNFSPISLRPYPVASHPAHPPHSKSDDHLNHDHGPLDPNPLTPQGHSPPDDFIHPTYSETPTLNYRSRDDDFLHASQSQPILDTENPYSPEMISFTPGPPPRKPPLPGPEKVKVKETSLDDLDNTTELDYELDETVRPISTYLETNMDDERGHAGHPGHPLRGAQSQYIPSAASRNGIDRNPFRETESDFKALSSRSKSMPLETEM